jgi:hypothetical protein
MTSTGKTFKILSNERIIEMCRGCERTGHNANKCPNDWWQPVQFETELTHQEDWQSSYQTELAYQEDWQAVPFQTEHELAYQEDWQEEDWQSVKFQTEHTHQEDWKPVQSQDELTDQDYEYYENNMNPPSNYTQDETIRMVSTNSRTDGGKCLNCYCYGRGSICTNCANCINPTNVTVVPMSWDEYKQDLKLLGGISMFDTFHEFRMYELREELAELEQEELELFYEQEEIVRMDEQYEQDFRLLKLQEEEQAQEELKFQKLLYEQEEEVSMHVRQMREQDEFRFFENMYEDEDVVCQYDNLHDQSRDSPVNENYDVINYGENDW